MFIAISDTYGPSSEAYIKLLISNFNGTLIKETNNIIEHVIKLAIIAKELTIFKKLYS